MFFLLPFLAVSCDTPGGYGRMERGGTTSYSGLDLAFGSKPSIDDEEHLRPPRERQDDTLNAQPIMLVALAVLVTALVLCIRARRRRAWLVATAAGAAVLTTIGVVVARSSLVDKVARQAARPFPRDKSAGDYVAVGIGYWGVVVFIGIALVLGALEGWMELRARDHDPPSS